MWQMLLVWSISTAESSRPLQRDSRVYMVWRFLLRRSPSGGQIVTMRADQSKTSDKIFLSHTDHSSQGRIYEVVAWFWDSMIWDQHIGPIVHGSSSVLGGTAVEVNDSRKVR